MDKKITNKKTKLLKIAFTALTATVSIQLGAAIILGLRTSILKPKEQINRKLEFDKLLKTVTKLNASAVSLYKDEKTITEIDIPENVKEIDEDTFSSFKYIKKITITKETSLIKQNAFSKMDSLEEIHIKDKSHIIGTADLSNKVKIKYGNGEYTKESWKAKWNKENVTIDKTITSLSYDAFKNYSNIKNIDTNKVKDISSNVFNGLNLQKMTFGDNIKNIVNSNLFNNLNVNELFIGKTLLLKPLFGQYKNSNIKKVTLLDSIDQIPDNAFSNMLTLENVELSENIQTIGNYAFANTSIKNINLKNVKKLGDFSFANTKINNINLKNVKELGSSVFKGLNFNEITLHDNLENVASDSLSDLKINKLTIGKSLNLFKNQLKNTNLSEIEFLNSINKIDSNTFSGISSLNKVTLSNSITEIGDYAFSKTNISNIDLKNVTKLGEYVFNSLAFDELTIKDILTSYSENTFKGLRLNKLNIGSSINHFKKNMLEKTGIQEVTFTNSVVEIPESAFKNISSLRKVNFSNTITKINKEAFFGTSISSIDFNNVKSIGDYSFAHTLIRNINFKNVIELGSKIFDGLSFEKLEIKDSIKNISSDSFLGLTIDKLTIGKCLEKLNSSILQQLKVKEINLLDSIEDIPNNIFNGLKSLENVNFSDTIKTIGDDAFANTLIKSLDIKNVKKIGARAFQNAYLFNNFKSWNKIETIENNAFENTRITNFTSPQNLKKLGNEVFKNCNMLEMNLLNEIQFVSPESFKSVSVDSLNLGKIIDANDSQYNSFNGKSLTQYFAKIKKITIKSNVKKIEDSSLSRSEFSDVVLEEGVEEILDNAFKESGIKKITIPDSLKKVNATSFENTPRIREVNIGDALRNCDGMRWLFVTTNGLQKVSKLNLNLNRDEIEDGFFANGINFNQYYPVFFEFDEINLASNITKIGNKSIYGLKSTKINLANLVSIGSNNFKNYELSNVILNSELKTLVSDVFSECKITGKISMPGVTEIQSRAFYKSSIGSIENTSKVITIGESAFEGGKDTSIFSFNNVTSLGKRAFYGHKSVRMAYFSSLKKIENNTFDNAQSLTDVSFDAELNYVGDESFKSTKLQNFDYENLSYIGKSAFESCYKLEIVNLKSATTINKRAFYDCESLMDISNEGKLNDNISMINKEVFSGCKNLTLNSNLPSKLERIKDNAFSNVKFTNDTIIFNNVKSVFIDYQAFQNCKTVKHINFNDKEVKINDRAFYSCYELLDIEGRQNVKSIGNKAFGDCPKLHKYTQSDFPNCTSWNNPY